MMSTATVLSRGMSKASKPEKAARRLLVILTRASLVLRRGRKAGFIQYTVSEG